jgi:hypothetical protein
MKSSSSDRFSCVDERIEWFSNSLEVLVEGDRWDVTGENATIVDSIRADDKKENLIAVRLIVLLLEEVLYF